MKENVRKYLSDLGKKGGKKGGAATKKRYGKKFYSEIGKKGMAKRWNKKRANEPKK